MKLVHFVERHQIKQLLHLAHAEKMTRYIQMATAPVKTRVVLYVTIRQVYLAVTNLRHILWQHLHMRLKTIE